MQRIETGKLNKSCFSENVTQMDNKYITDEDKWC